jgi:hypothetical protein
MRRRESKKKFQQTRMLFGYLQIDLEGKEELR